MDLVREYARNSSEEAFTALVSRHVNLVYSVALHQLRDPSLAEEVTQAAFIILARKAGALGPKTILSAWLCRTAQYAAANALRAESRRQCREQEIYMESVSNSPESEASSWPDIAPLLNLAMGALSEKDHSAIVLRFFEGKDLKQVGAALRVGEDTAKTRVRRALEKLRKFFVKRGITLSATVIGGAISANSLQAAPAELVKTVAKVAITKGATASASTLALLQGTLKIMAWTKLKTTLVVCLTAGTATVVVRARLHSRQKAREESVWNHITAVSRRQLLDAPPIVSIRPSKPGSGLGNSHIGDNNKQLASDKTVATILRDAYHVGPGRVVAMTPLPGGTYDFIVSLPSHQDKALQAAIKEKFGLVGKIEKIETNVMLLKIARPNAPGLKHPSGRVSMNSMFARRFNIPDSPIGVLAFDLEKYLHMPVIDQTDLTGRYDIDLKWNADPRYADSEAMKKALLDQLGLELVPDTQTIDMLVVTKAK